jgi:hypothetical protein
VTYAEAMRQWALIGAPTLLERPSGLVVVFVQRSAMRGRPWLRFGLDLNGCSCCYHWTASPTAHASRREAIAGMFGLGVLTLRLPGRITYT